MRSKNLKWFREALCPHSFPFFIHIHIDFNSLVSWHASWWWVVTRPIRRVFLPHAQCSYSKRGFRSTTTLTRIKWLLKTYKLIMRLLKTEKKEKVLKPLPNYTLIHQWFYWEKRNQGMHLLTEVPCHPLHMYTDITQAFCYSAPWVMHPLNLTNPALTQVLHGMLLIH